MKVTKVQGLNYEHFEYMQVDALADMLEEMGVIFPHEPYVYDESKPPLVSWGYRLPDGTEGGRDDRWQAADEVRRHYTSKMFRREESESGLDEYQVQNEAGRNLVDPFNELRRGLARLEVVLFCRPKTEMPNGWPELVVNFLGGISLLVNVLTRLLRFPRPNEVMTRKEAADQADWMEGVKGSATYFLDAIFEEVAKSQAIELYFRSRHFFDAIQAIALNYLHLEGLGKKAG